ncbi:FadR/GntR family transcriptional regulator [Nocardioides lianchengensis]|uniref:DNA-binding transcriptional regulator, FadR family n=1 Tax=Nocardioides lianchengensis TaxID=1045774 RepID=A0A1G7ATX5_9ACTN|nr:FCD domain-containing protein [Nocardioides lianchengensis]NYG13296.1 DNA-binding FadR family transcriptional regulator [Nocardioides lianchengensis]SDE18231.1 DNA-binding transcriptional regulator, FadR family [Nocardioides lianchengensis]
MSTTRPQKTALLVAQRIVADINRRGNTVGDRLPPERVMLEEYEVGRGTLRESLRFLELQGVIALKPGPGGGPIVRRPDPTALATSLTLLLQFDQAPLRSVAEARAGLEPALARLAAEQMTEDQLGELRAVAESSEHLDDPRGFLEQDRHFHDLVARGSGNPVLAHLSAALLLLDRPAGGTETAARRSTARQAHLRIVEAIASRDAGETQTAMADHLAQDLRHAEEAQLAAPVVWESP